MESGSDTPHQEGAPKTLGYLQALAREKNEAEPVPSADLINGPKDELQKWIDAEQRRLENPEPPQEQVQAEKKSNDNGRFKQSALAALKQLDFYSGGRDVRDPSFSDLSIAKKILIYDSFSAAMLEFMSKTNLENRLKDESTKRSKDKMITLVSTPGVSVEGNGLKIGPGAKKEEILSFLQQGETIKNGKVAQESMKGKSELALSIESAQNFDELYKILRKAKGIQGAHIFYDSETLIADIDHYRKFKIDNDLTIITRSEGLHDKVEELFLSEQNTTRPLIPDKNIGESVKEVHPKSTKKAMVRGEEFEKQKIESAKDQNGKEIKINDGVKWKSLDSQGKGKIVAFSEHTFGDIFAEIHPFDGREPVEVSIRDIILEPAESVLEKINIPVPESADDIIKHDNYVLEDMSALIDGKPVEVKVEGIKPKFKDGDRVKIRGLEHPWWIRGVATKDDGSVTYSLEGKNGEIGFESDESKLGSFPQDSEIIEPPRKKEEPKLDIDISDKNIILEPVESSIIPPESSQEKPVENEPKPVDYPTPVSEPTDAALKEELESVQKDGFEIIEGINVYTTKHAVENSSSKDIVDTKAEVDNALKNLKDEEKEILKSIPNFLIAIKGSDILFPVYGDSSKILSVGVYNTGEEITTAIRNTVIPLIKGTWGSGQPQLEKPVENEPRPVDQSTPTPEPVATPISEEAKAEEKTFNIGGYEFHTGQKVELDTYPDSDKKERFVIVDFNGEWVKAKEEKTGRESLFQPKIFLELQNVETQKEPESASQTETPTKINISDLEVAKGSEEESTKKAMVRGEEFEKQKIESAKDQNGKEIKINDGVKWKSLDSQGKGKIVAFNEHTFGDVFVEVHPFDGREPVEVSIKDITLEPAESTIIPPELSQEKPIEDEPKPENQQESAGTSHPEVNNSGKSEEQTPEAKPTIELTEKPDQDLVAQKEKLKNELKVAERTEKDDVLEEMVKKIKKLEVDIKIDQWKRQKQKIREELEKAEKLGEESDELLEEKVKKIKEIEDIIRDLGQPQSEKPVEIEPKPVDQPAPVPEPTDAALKEEPKPEIKPILEPVSQPALAPEPAPAAQSSSTEATAGKQEKVPSWRESGEWKKFEMMRDDLARYEAPTAQLGMSSVGLEIKRSEYRDYKNTIAEKIEESLKREAGTNLTPEQELALNQKIHDTIHEELLKNEHYSYLNVLKEHRSETLMDKTKEMAKSVLGTKFAKWYLKQNRWARLMATTVLFTAGGYAIGTAAVGGTLLSAAGYGVGRGLRGGASLLGGGAARGAAEKRWSEKDLEKKVKEKEEEIKNSEESLEEKSKKFAELQAEADKERFWIRVKKGLVTVGTGAGAGILAGLGEGIASGKSSELLHTPKQPPEQLPKVPTQEQINNRAAEIYKKNLPGKADIAEVPTKVEPIKSTISETLQPKVPTPEAPEVPEGNMQDWALKVEEGDTNFELTEKILKNNHKLDDLDEVQKIFVTESVVNKIMESPTKYGLNRIGEIKAGLTFKLGDLRDLTNKENENWLDDVVDKAKELSELQKHGIMRDYNKIHDWAVQHPNVNLTSVNVPDILANEPILEVPLEPTPEVPLPQENYRVLENGELYKNIEPTLPKSVPEQIIVPKPIPEEIPRPINPKVEPSLDELPKSKTALQKQIENEITGAKQRLTELTTEQQKPNMGMKPPETVFPHTVENNTGVVREGIRTMAGDTTLMQNTASALRNGINNTYGKSGLFGFGGVEGIKTPEWGEMARLPASKVVEYFTGDSKESGLANDIMDRLSNSKSHRALMNQMAGLMEQANGTIRPLGKENMSQFMERLVAHSLKTQLQNLPMVA